MSNVLRGVASVILSCVQHVYMSSVNLVKKFVAMNAKTCLRNVPHNVSLAVSVYAKKSGTVHGL